MGSTINVCEELNEYPEICHTVSFRKGDHVKDYRQNTNTNEFIY